MDNFWRLDLNSINRLKNYIYGLIEWCTPEFEDRNEYQRYFVDENHSYQPPTLPPKVTPVDLISFSDDNLDPPQDQSIYHSIDT